MYRRTNANTTFHGHFVHKVCTITVALPCLWSFFRLQKEKYILVLFIFSLDETRAPKNKLNDSFVMCSRHGPFVLQVAQVTLFTNRDIGGYSCLNLSVLSLLVLFLKFYQHNNIRLYFALRNYISWILRGETWYYLVILLILSTWTSSLDKI